MYKKVIGAVLAGAFLIGLKGVLIETTLDYIQSDAPIALDVPRFNQ